MSDNSEVINFNHKNMEIVETEDIKEEAIDINNLSVEARFDTEYAQQVTLKCDIPLNVVDLLSMKHEENPEEKKNPHDSKISIKTEIDYITNEVGKGELELTHEQLKSFKIEDVLHKRDCGNECTEHTRTKSCISLDKLEPDNEHYIKDMEIIKPEPNKIDTFDDMENQNTVLLWEHNYCKYGPEDVMRHCKYKNNIHEHLKLNTQESDLNYKNIEIVEIEDIKNEMIDIVDLSLNEVHSDSEYVKYRALECDIPLNEVSLESIKHEDNVKEEDTYYGTEMSIKTEINDIKDEEDTKEFELSYEQVKSIKTEDAVYKRDSSNEYVEHTSTESSISLDKSQPDNRQCIKDINIKPEPNEEKDTSNNIEVDLEREKTVLQCEHDYCKYETEHQRQRTHPQHIKLNTQEPDLSYKNMDIFKAADIKEEVIDTVDSTSVKVTSGIEYVEKGTHRSDNQSAEVDLAFMKYEQTVKEEKSAYDTENISKTEIDDIKSEVGTEELESSCDQLKSINIEDAISKRDCSNECMEHPHTKCNVSFDRLEPERQYINNIETIKLEQNEEDTSNAIEISKCKNNIQQHTPSCPAKKAKDKSMLSTHFKEVHKGNFKYFECNCCEYITNRRYNLKLHFTRRHSEIGKSYQYSNRKYKSKGLVLHRRQDHNEYTEWLGCRMCDFKTKYEHILLKHYRLKHFASEIFRCALCNYETKYKHLLLQHHRIKHDDAAETFHCELCNYKTKYKSNLSLHHRTKHDDAAAIFACELCDFKTKNKYEVSQHLIVKHADSVVNFHCELCDFKTKNKDEVSQHQTVKHADSAVILHCKLCHFKTKNKYEVLQHVLLKHYRLKHFTYEILRCGLCDYKTKYKHLLLQHRRIKHDDAAKSFHCKLCDFKTKYKHSLLQHHRIKHGDAAESFQCKLCNYKTKYKHCMLQHHRIKHDDAAEFFQCKLCDFKTKYGYNLVKHHRLTHDDAAKIFHCESCDYKTKSKYCMLKHQRLKHDVEVFHCESCDFKTKDKHNLLGHCKVKHEIGSLQESKFETLTCNDSAEIFHCELCDFKSNYLDDLFLHNRLIHGESAEIFCCELCNFETKSKRGLWSHYRSRHADSAETFHCKMCDYRTNIRHSLLQHILKHNDAAEMFHCAQCDFKTNVKRNFLRHHRSNHDGAAELYVYDCRTKCRRKLLLHCGLRHKGSSEGCKKQR